MVAVTLPADLRGRVREVAQTGPNGFVWGQRFFDCLGQYLADLQWPAPRTAGGEAGVTWMELAIDFEVSTGISIPPATRHLVEAGLLQQDASKKITVERVACAEAYVVGDEDLAPAPAPLRRHALQVARGTRHLGAGERGHTLAPGARWEPHTPAPATRERPPRGHASRDWAGKIIGCAVCGRTRDPTVGPPAQLARFMFEPECVGHRESESDVRRRLMLSQMAEKRRKAAPEEGTGGAPARPTAVARRPLNARGDTMAAATRRLGNLLGRPVVPGPLDWKTNNRVGSMRTLDGQKGHVGLHRRPIFAGGEATERVLRQIAADLRTPQQRRRERAEAQERREQRKDVRAKEYDDAYHGTWEPTYDEENRRERARTFLARIPRLARGAARTDGAAGAAGAAGGEAQAPGGAADAAEVGEGDAQADAARDAAAEGAGGARRHGSEESAQGRGPGRRGREQSRGGSPENGGRRAQGRGPGHRRESRGRGAPRARLR